MRNSGFTLIEILVVIALGAILSTAGFLSYNNYQIRRSVELSLQELSSTVEQVQRRSVTQEDGDRWSIRFTATSTGEDTYSIYRGDTYSTGSTTQSYSFKRAVHFSEPSGDRSVDFNFEPVSGKVDNKKVITITNDSPYQIAGDVIVNTLGVVTEKMRDNIVGYWHFDEGTGATTTDASGEGNNGSINGTTWISGDSCIAGDCLDFDGTDDYIPLKNSYQYFSDGITVSAWVKTNSNGIILSYDRSEIFRFGIGSSGTSGKVTWNTDDGGIDDMSGSITVTDGNWHHVVATYDPNSSLKKIYVDGTLDSQKTWGGGDLGDGTTRFGFIGTGSEASSYDGATGPSEFFNGRMDEVKIYSTALSSSTIKANYNDLK